VGGGEVKSEGRDFREGRQLQHQGNAEGSLNICGFWVWKITKKRLIFSMSSVVADGSKSSTSQNVTEAYGLEPNPTTRTPANQIADYQTKHLARHATGVHRCYPQHGATQLRQLQFLVSANKDEISVAALESQRVESWMRGSHMIRDDPRPRVVLLRFTASLQVLPALLPPCHSTY
jgi:acyl-CoA thioesterase